MPDSPLPEHVTLPLLDRVVGQSLDEEYAEVAARRHGADASTEASRTTKVALTLGIIGLLGSTAFVINAQDADVDETSRTVLISRVSEERAALARDQDQIGKLQAQVVRLQQSLTGQQQRLASAQARLENLRLISGYAPAHGPGVRVTVDDSPSGLPEEAVRDEDLALLVDGLWGAGAEAIAINGKRLTVLSAIRNSALAINVNSRPLSPPYVVEAIGDPRTLQSRLLASSRGNDFFGLAEQLGFEYELSNVDDLTLPGARSRDLRYAMAPLSPRDDRMPEGGRQ